MGLQTSFEIRYQFFLKTTAEVFKIMKAQLQKKLFPELFNFSRNNTVELLPSLKTLLVLLLKDQLSLYAI